MFFFCLYFRIETEQPRDALSVYHITLLETELEKTRSGLSEGFLFLFIFYFYLYVLSLSLSLLSLLLVVCSKLYKYILYSKWFTRTCSLSLSLSHTHTHTHTSPHTHTHTHTHAHTLSSGLIITNIFHLSLYHILAYFLPVVYLQYRETLVQKNKELCELKRTSALYEMKLREREIAEYEFRSNINQQRQTEELLSAR